MGQVQLTSSLLRDFIFMSIWGCSIRADLEATRGCLYRSVSP